MGEQVRLLSETKLCFYLTRLGTKYYSLWFQTTVNNLPNSVNHWIVIGKLNCFRCNFPITCVAIFFPCQCNRCKPLYNDKPFRRGDSDDSYPCVKCECNNHANSCVYNQTLDTSPDSRTQGGGGVCIDCQHNTTGRFCNRCKERFYRESGKSLKSPDACSPCGCEGLGVEPGELDCVKVCNDYFVCCSSERVLCFISRSH